MLPFGFTRFLGAALLTVTFIPSAARGDALVPQRVAGTDAGFTPQRFTGQLNVLSGANTVISSATLVRRFTALTSASNLCDPTSGFATNLVFTPGRYGNSKPFGQTRGSRVDLLAGYQSVAARDGATADTAFDRDLASLLLLDPAPDNLWASWAAAPETLNDPNGLFFVLGYVRAFGKGKYPYAVNTTGPYTLTPETEALYETPRYFTYGGMSGGPVYSVLPGRDPLLVAENVAGTGEGTNPQPSDPNTSSSCRAITEEARRLLINSEYQAGTIVAAKLKGPTVAAAGSTVLFKTGVIYGDGVVEKKRYDELQLTADSAFAGSVVIQKIANDKFQVTFGSDLPSGTQINLVIGRDTAPIQVSGLRSTTVTIQ